VHVEGITRRFKFVKIPADEGVPFEQCEVTVAADAAGRGQLIVYPVLVLTVAQDRQVLLTREK
jgi:hypothetical protein